MQNRNKPLSKRTMRDNRLVHPITWKASNEPNAILYKHRMVHLHTGKQPDFNQYDLNDPNIVPYLIYQNRRPTDPQTGQFSNAPNAITWGAFRKRAMKQKAKPYIKHTPPSKENNEALFMNGLFAPDEMRNHFAALLDTESSVTQEQQQEVSHINQQTSSSSETRFMDGFFTRDEVRNLFEGLLDTQSSEEASEQQHQSYP